MPATDSDTVESSIPYKEIIEAASKGVLVTAGVCYVIGLLVINSYLKQFGDFSINLLQVDYAMAGALFLFTSSLVTAAWGSVIKLREVFARWRSTGYVVKGVETIAGFLLYGLWVGFIYILVDVLMGKPHKYDGGDKLSVTLALLIHGVLMLCIYGITSAYIGVFLDKKERPRFTAWHAIGGVATLAVSLLILLLCIFFYGSLVYPRLGSAYGGGSRGQIILIPYPEKLPALAATGLEAVPETNKIGPIQILYETSDSLIVTKSLSKMDGPVRSIQLKKDLFSAILYLQPEGKGDTLPSVPVKSKPAPTTEITPAATPEGTPAPTPEGR